MLIYRHGMVPAMLSSQFVSLQKQTPCTCVFPSPTFGSGNGSRQRERLEEVITCCRHRVRNEIVHG